MESGNVQGRSQFIALQKETGDELILQGGGPTCRSVRKWNEGRESAVGHTLLGRSFPWR